MTTSISPAHMRARRVVFAGAQARALHAAPTRRAELLRHGRVLCHARQRARRALAASICAALQQVEQWVDHAHGGQVPRGEQQRWVQASVWGG